MLAHNVGRCWPGEIVQFLEARVTALQHRFTHCINRGTTSKSPIKAPSQFRLKQMLIIISHFRNPAKTAAAPLQP